MYPACVVNANQSQEYGKRNGQQITFSVTVLETKSDNNGKQNKEDRKSRQPEKERIQLGDEDAKPLWTEVESRAFDNNSSADNHWMIRKQNIVELSHESYRSGHLLWISEQVTQCFLFCFLYYFYLSNNFYTGLVLFAT